MKEKKKEDYAILFDVELGNIATEFIFWRKHFSELLKFIFIKIYVVFFHS